MSERKESIDLKAPGRLKKELFASHPQPCGYCHGSGWFWGGDREPVKTPCPDCNGSGEVRAIVTVEWEAMEREMTELLDWRQGNPYSCEE